MAIVTYIEWAEFLKDLIDRSEIAVKNKDLNKIKECQKLLSAYQKQSPSKCEFLDQIAEETKMELITSSVSGDIVELVKINNKLDKEIKKVNNVTEELNKSRSDILLEDLREALKKINEKLIELKNLESELKIDEKENLLKLMSLIEIFQNEK